MVLHPNIDLSIAVRAKEQFLVGSYSTSLDTFREVQRQIQAHITALEHELEHGDPAGASRKAVEDAYEEWTKCLGMLQEEFGIVQMLQEAGQAFKIAPGANAGEKSSGGAAAFAAPGLTDAQLQAQHLAKQAATDIRDPDVWPPPTTEAPVRPAKARQSSAPFVQSQWAAAQPAAQPAAAARPPVASRTPMKGPLPAAAATDDAGAQPSNRLPAWASNPAPAAAPVSKPVARPRFVRKTSEPPAAVVAPAAAAPAAAVPKKAAVPRKPAVPTGGRKSVAPSKHKKDEAAAASSSSAAAEDGGRVKYEAASKEEQEMADMIEREILDKRPNVKMDDIAGLAGAKQLLQEAVVLPRLIPGYFTGKRKPWKGVLMFGPPGTGKTLLAKAVATECNTTFFNVSPSTVTSKYRGDSEKLMKLLFEMARFYAPSTIFMDEVDGLCSARGGGGEHEASRRVKGEILQQMDGASSSVDYDPAKSVIVLGATNLPWELDSAFLRRFEKRVHIDLPDQIGRAEMFRINTEGMEVDEECKAPDGKWEKLVEMSEGYSGADIAVVCNDASMLGLRRLLAGKSNAEVAKLSKEDFKQPITLADFQAVFATVKSSAGKNDLEKYREWMKEFGSAI